MLKTTLVMFLSTCLGNAVAGVVPLDLADNQWTEVSNTHLESVAPVVGEFPHTWGVEGPHAVFGDWAGTAFDYKKERMYATGGGHCGYYGNEIYRFDVDSLKWTRLTDPTIPPPTYGCGGSGFTEQYECLIDTVTNDTTPQSRHTYSGTCYIQHADRFLMLSRGYGRTDRDSLLKPDSITWIFDPATGRWENRYPSTSTGYTPKRTIADFSIYDSVTQKVFLHSYDENGPYGQTNGWWTYDYATDHWTRLNTDNGGTGSGCFDTKRRLAVEPGNGNIRVCPVDSATMPAQVWTTLGGGRFLNNDGFIKGMDYDPVNDRYVGWYEEGPDTVYVLDPETKVWQTFYAPNNLGACGTGIYNRIRYSVHRGAFVCAATTERNVHLFKLVIPRYDDVSAITSLDIRGTLTVEQYLATALTVTATYANSQTDTVLSSTFLTSLDTAIALIEGDGVVRAVRVGTARITALKITRKGSYTDTVTVNVVASTATVDSIRLDAVTAHILMDRDTFALTGTVYCHNGGFFFDHALDTAARFVSDDTGKVVASGNLLTGKAVAASVAVVATLQGKSDTCLVRVMPNPAFIRRINFQPSTAPVPVFGWDWQNYFTLYSGSRGYGWLNYPGDANTAGGSSLTNFLLLSRVIANAGDAYRVDVPEGDYLVKIGMGDVAPYYYGWSYAVHGTDTLLKWYDKPDDAGVAVDTVHVTGSNGLILNFTGFVCYLVVISMEGVDINEVAEDGNLVPNYHNGGLDADGNGAGPAVFSMAVSPNPFNPMTRISCSVPKTLVNPELSVYSQDGRLVRSLPVRTGKMSVAWDGRDQDGAGVASGIYVVRLKVGNRVLFKKALMVK